jgi:hypothetical protein
MHRLAAHPSVVLVDHHHRHLVIAIMPCHGHLACNPDEPSALFISDVCTSFETFNTLHHTLDRLLSPILPRLHPRRIVFREQS